mgnify:CR=1 FL=1
MAATLQTNTTTLKEKRQLFITDLDHTLLKSNQSISNFTTTVWNSLSLNALLGVATARSFHKVQEFLQNLRLNSPLILLDGAMITTPKKEIIALYTIDKALGDSVIEQGVKLGIYPFVVGLNKDNFNEIFWYPKICNEHQKCVLDGYKNDPRLALKNPIEAMESTLKIVYFGSYELLSVLTKHLKAQFANTLEYKLSPEKYYNGWFLTILHPMGDKSHAIKTVASYIDLPIENITVFGDSINDIGMFGCAGKSVAVANALDEVKEAASEVLPHTNDQDGVAHYLARFL